MDHFAIRAIMVQMQERPRLYTEILVRNARTEKIRGKRIADAISQNVVLAVPTEVGDSA